MARLSIARGGRRNLGLVLSGGGARGAFQVGAYERLIESPRFERGPDVLSGTSAGAINGALIAAGKSPREMMEFWHGLSADPPVVASAQFFEDAIGSFFRLSLREIGAWLTSIDPARAFLRHVSHHLALRPGSVLAIWVEYLLASRFELVSRLLEGIGESFVADTALLRARLVDAIGGEEVPEGNVRLAINTMDAHTGRVVRFVTMNTPHTRSPDYEIVDAITVDMVLASASIPLLFPAVQVGSHSLWDGGLLVNTPLAPVVAMGADEIVTVLVTEPPDPTPGPFPHFGRAVERAVDSFLENAYNIDRKLLLERNRVARIDGGPYREVKLYEVVRPARDEIFTPGSYLYFEHGVLQAMYEQGQESAAAWLDAGPCVDEIDPREAWDAGSTVPA